MITDTDDEERLNEARYRAARIPVEPEQRRARRYRRATALAVATLLLGIGVAVLVGVALVRGTLTAGPAAAPTWQVTAGAVVGGAGLLLAACGAVENVSNTKRQWATRTALAALTRSQRKELAGRVRGHRPTDPARLPLARLVARQSLDQRTVFVMVTGIATSQIGSVLSTPDPGRVAVTVGVGLALAAAWVFLHREARRARAFLDHHPAEGTAPVAAAPEDDPARS